MQRRRRGIGTLTLAATLAACGLASADDKPADFSPFAIPWSDSAPGTATDVSHLNSTKPAGAHGRIVARSGHFVEADTGRRVRFLGINLPAANAFPSHEDADKIAAALAKYGINVVRLHHMDNSWGRQEGSLIVQGQPGTMQLDSKSLDKLDYLIAALAKQGIYSNINLKVSHDWKEGDGLSPEAAKEQPWPFKKRVDTFDRKIIDLQKDFARELLTHVNPYTKLSYVDDPAVAFVEINNENSLLGDPMEPLGRGLLTKLGDPYRSELAEQWNAWLKKKYKHDDALKAAWQTSGDQAAAPLLNQQSKWSFEHQGNSAATMNVDESANKLPDAAAPVELNVTAIDGPAWYVQTHITGLTLHSGNLYTLSFRAKADAKRSINVNAGLDQDDWHNIGLNETAELTTNWKTFTFVFDCSDSVAEHNRVAWVLGGAKGKVWIDNASLKPGAAGVGLLAGESLSDANLKLPTQMSKPQYKDFVSFLADTEHAYADEMRNFLRRDLGVKANITDTQVDYGGLTGIEREEGSDYADSHAYWQHPAFQHKAWDINDWLIQNTPMVDTFLGDGRGGTLAALAQTRVAGKPFTVSEYDHPAPSDYVAEMMPMLATFAAAQDWDGLYLFDIGRYGGPTGSEKINGFFDTWNHPAVRSQLPAAALIFRGEQFQPLGNSMTLQLPPQPYNTVPFNIPAWKNALGHPVDSLTTRLAITLNDKLTSPAVTGGEDRRFTSDGIQVEKAKGGAVWLAHSSSVAAAAGYLQNDTITCGPMRLQLQGGTFASVIAVALDSKPLNQSAHVLVTVNGRAENNDMVWNAARTTISNQWGKGPVNIQKIEGTITLALGGKAVEGSVLDPTGHPLQPLALKVDANGDVAVNLGSAAQSVWYELRLQR